MEIQLSQTSFGPGDSIRGTVHWQPEESIAESIEIRLIWYTAGKGDRDHEIVTSRNRCRSFSKHTG